MEALLVSIVVVALSEVGDKTQLLALVLAARLRKPVPIVLGILVATLFNHTLAGLIGAWLRTVVPPMYLRWLVSASFFAVALWTLKIDRIEVEPTAQSRWGAFTVTAIAFFLAEMGDKTQIATVVLAAQFGNLVAVVAGSTLGMLIADVPAVWLGNAAAMRIPLRVIRYVTAAVFTVLGIVALLLPAPA